MKFLLLIAVVFVVLWFMRGLRNVARRDDAEEARRTAKAPPPVQQDMVECPVCRVHLPRADALPGPDGQLYCCAEHRPRAGA